MEELINKTLVFEYFAGNVSPLQKKTIETWLAKPESRDIYYQWLHEWESNNLQVSTNWQSAFAQTRQRVQDSEIDKPTTTLTSRYWWQPSGIGRWLAAASVLLMLGIGGWLAEDIIRYKTIQTGFGETKHYVLPDGSVVDLNANSSIRFARFGFGATGFLSFISGATTGRKVELTGEADFSVRHLATHQRFVVLTAKGLAVNVLGTQFTVFSRERRTQVALRSGKVELTMPQQAHQQPLTMKPGDLVTLDDAGKLALQQTAHPENLSAWKQHRITFEKTSLREIAAMLQENYGFVVTIDDDGLASRTISGSFPAQNGNEVVKLIAELLQINYFRDNNKVTFTN